MSEDLVGVVKYMRRTVTPWHTSKEIADMLIANDVVPVVRCKDCKKWTPWPDRKQGFCPCSEHTTKAKHFCSYGEKK